MGDRHEIIVSRRPLLLLVAGVVFPVAACGRSDSAGHDAQEVEARPTTDGDSSTLEAPDAAAAPLAVAGRKVNPVSGIRLSLPGEASALAPEKLGDKRLSVVYVWPTDASWGYLAVEGPASFQVGADIDAARAAAEAERERLVSALVNPSEVKASQWDGFSQCVQLTWSQRTIPPGWSEETSVDAIALFLVDGVSRSYTLVAYVARGKLDSQSPAFKAMCSLGSG